MRLNKLSTLAGWTLCIATLAAVPMQASAACPGDKKPSLTCPDEKKPSACPDEKKPSLTCPDDAKKPSAS